MDRHEMQARVDAQIAEWKRNLDIMKAKAEAKTGDAKAEAVMSVANFQKQFDDLKIEAAKAWDTADDTWDSASKDLEIKLAQWQLDAKKAWNDLTK